MTVYVDELIILNLYISFFLLLSTEKLVRREVRFRRRFAASIASALFSLYIFLPEVHFVLSAVVRLIMSAVIVMINFGLRNRRLYFKSLFIFWSANFIFAGIMYGIWQIFLPGNMAINNSFVYLSVSPMMLIISTVVCYVLISIYRKVTGKYKPDSLYYNICLTYKSNSVVVRALLDTGNSLHDAFTDRPVIVITYETASKLLPKETVKYFGSALTPPPDFEGYRVVPFSAVGSSGILPAFYLKCNIIGNETGSNTTGAIAAVNASRLSDDYDALVGLGLIQLLEE